MARVDVIGQLTSDEILVIQAIENGSYFVENGTPTNTGDNQNFTLASAPNPADSLKVYKNGARLKGGGVDFTMTTPTNMQLTNALDDPANEIITIDYRFSPI